MMVIGDIPRRNAKLYPRKPGLKFEERVCTFSEFNDRLNRLATGFLHLGIAKGDRVGVLERNCPEYIEIYFAMSKIGTVTVPISPRLSTDEIVFILRDSGVKALVFGTEFVETVHLIRREIRDLDHLILLGDNQTQGFPSYEGILSAGAFVEPDVEVKESDLYTIMYTSGTTGRPKGVMGTHKNHMANTINMTLGLSIQNDDITLLVMPLYHMGGLWPTLVHFYRGAAVILERHFDEVAVLNAIEKEKVTTFNLVPTMLYRLLEYPDLPKYDCRSLRTIFYAGAPMPINLLRRGLEYFGNRLMTGLGLTESSGGITCLQKEELCLVGPENEARRLGSVGRDFINVVTRTVNERGEDVKPGEVGEVIAKGDNITPGYWNLPEETIKTIRDGWLYTGDLATIDDEGYIYVIDRAKDIIISGGENIASKEVEDSICNHPDVLEVAVIGIPDEKWGEAVHAVVVPKQEADLTEKAVIEYCKRNLASFKKPNSVEFIEALPRNALGKVEKHKLKVKYWEGSVKRGLLI